MGEKQTFIEINGRRYHAETGQPVKAASSIKSAASPAPAKKDGRQAAKHTAQHRQASSQTLMRQTVKKPSAKGRGIKAHSRLDALARHFLEDVEQPLAVSGFDEKRLSRAKRIRRSQAISRFPQLSPVVPPPPPLVKPANKPIVKPAAHAKPQTTAELLEKVIQQATSHEQAPVKLKRRRGVNKRRASAASAVALAIILTAVITGQNSTDAQLQTASTTAGFTVNLPAYQPAGFKRVSLDADKGVVAIGFHGRDNLSFSITQKPASGLNQAELTNFITDQNANFQMVDASGRTVYLYGQQNATWVSHGVWYDVHSFGALDDHQLIRLASSS